MIVLATVVLAAGVFALDLLARGGEGMWGLYLLPLLLTLRARRSWQPLAFAGLASALIVTAGYATSIEKANRAEISGRGAIMCGLWLAAVWVARRVSDKETWRESEQRLRGVMDQLPAGIFTKDTDGRYLEFNRQFEINTRREREELAGKMDPELFARAAAGLLADMDEKVSAGQTVSREMQLGWGEGTRHQMVVKAPLLDREGHRAGSCGVVVNLEMAISERARAELAASNERLGLIARAASSIMGAVPLPTQEINLAEQARHAFSVDGCVISLLEDEQLVVLASAGIPTPDAPPRVSASWGVYREILVGRKPIFVPDVRLYASTSPAVMSPGNDFSFVTYAGAPLFAQDQVLGILSVYSRAPARQFSATDLDHLAIVANQIAVAIVNDRLFKEVHNQRDKLAAQIMERKLAVDALRESEARFRTAVDHFPNAFAIYNAERRLQFVNACGVRMSGYAPADLLGRTDEELFPRQLTDAYLPALRRAVQTRRQQEVEFTGALPVGTRTLIVNYVPLFDARGSVRQVLGITYDITERKRAEEATRQSESRFRAISEQALMGIYIVQGERLAYVNPRFAEIFGYPQADLPGLSSFFDLIVEEERERARLAVRAHLAGETPDLRLQSHGRRRDGRVIAIETRGVQTEIEGAFALIGTLNDVTEHEQDQAVLQRTTEQLQTLSRRLLELQEAERRHIARELHDEIGQALTALKINLQAVQRSAGAAPFAPRLVDSVTIVDRILRQVRDLSLDLRPSLLDDLGLCAALRWYTDQQAQRAGLSIQFVAGELAARFDPALETACFRVAQEALTNVVRHARAAAVRVHLQVETDFLHLVVSDDGIGFDPERLRTQGRSGASMGLLGMEERASLMRGRIKFESVLEHGTSVHAWFPLTPSVDSNQKASIPS